MCIRDRSKKRRPPSPEAVREDYPEPPERISEVMPESMPTYEDPYQEYANAKTAKAHALMQGKGKGKGKGKGSKGKYQDTHVHNKAPDKKNHSSFNQKEKRKRDLGMQSGHKNYVEEEKRVLRQSGGGFD
eukprot:TRINITY_DN11576_c0_g1_i3.p1 TRINITY_DN11576_c0_g1~~TRINITY_DN11576_c0_g1_i3.p1  ORF type:complete len:130 (+),score=19.41 TRINITY_DN11576_c0_g1_i3:99-488(+)